MDGPDPSLHRAEEVARALAGRPIDCLRRVGGGRNSRVYRVEAGGGTFALKQYPSREEDPRDRLGTEVAALRWMHDQGLALVPMVVAVDGDRNFALLSWVEGTLVREATELDIDQAADFLGRIHSHRHTRAIPTGHLASEACLSAGEVERQIRARATLLRSLPEENALWAFLDGPFGVSLAQLLGRAKERIGAATVDFDTVLPPGKRSLVPSDFGFHNALRGSDGKLTFLDFEYFGWDDPVKLTADVMLHPGTPLTPSLRLRFRERAERLYGDDPGFRARLDALYPLFGLRWVLILLNEFHPERWRRRVLAGAEESWTQAKARQLAAAQGFLAETTE